MAFVLLLVVSITKSYSQVRIPFAPRASSATPTQTVYHVKGDFTMIGNANLQLVNYSDTADNNRDMEYIDIDGDPNTFNSSSSNLTFSTENGALPDCSKILYAGLYWAGRADTGSDPNLDGDNNPNTFQVTKNGVTKNFDKRKVLLKGPLATTYTEVLATPPNNLAFPTGGVDRNLFAAYTEITDYVKLNGIGNYFVADMPLVEGHQDITGFSGGWGMVVVYENSKMQWRDITVFDGFAYVDGASTDIYTITANGFNASVNGDINLKLGLMAGEGEVAYSGDYFEIEKRNSGDYEPLNHSENSTGNFFNSTILTGGNVRNPSIKNNAGIDIVMFDIDNGNNNADPTDDNSIINNGQTSTTFRYGTAGDSYSIFNVTFAVDAYVPESEGVLTSISVNGNPPGSTINPNDDANYKIEIKNTGTEAITNTILTIPLPASVNPINLGLDITTNTNYTPLINHSAPIFNPTIGTNGAIVWNIGTLPLPANPDTVLADISFKFTVTTNCSILSNPSFDPNVSVNGTVSGIGATSNIPFDFQLIQGYESTGSCIGEPILAPNTIPIDYLDYINEAPTASNPDPININCKDDIPTPNIDVVTDEADNSGITPIVAFVSDTSDNNSCPEIITRIYSVTDDCDNTINVTQTITITPIPLIISDVINETVATGTYTNQTDLDTAFALWLTNFSVTGGCNPTGQFDQTYTAPTLCGGSVNVIYNATDLCENGQDVATFTVQPISPLVISDVQDLTVNSCTYANQDELNTAFDNWINGFSVTGGNNPQATDLSSLTAPLLCNGGTVNITYNVTDLCENGQDTAAFTVNIPNPLVVSNVTNETIPAGTYTDQADLDAAFALWLTNFSVTGGCNPTGQFDQTYTAPLLCGGSVNVIYNATDLCENGQDIATFTVQSTNPLVISDVQDLTVNSCTYANQDELNTAFNNWINGFSVTGGNNPQATDLSSLTAPLLCNGGTVNVTYNVTDLCENGQDTAAFTVNIPNPLVVSNITNETIPAGTYTDQADLDAAFALWLTNFSVTGGCNPTGQFDQTYTAPLLCGGSVNVIYNATDLCENGQDVATFTVQSTNPLVISDVQDLTVNSCTYANQDELNTAFNNWINGFSVTGGNNPQATDLSSLTAPLLCNGGTVNVTYNVTDLCENGQDTASFMVNISKGITYSNTKNKTTDACNFSILDITTAQSDLDNDIAAWVNDQTMTINNSITGGCSPVVGNNFTNQSIDFCTGGSITITWDIVDLCETTNRTATYTFTKPTDPVFNETNLPTDETVECDAITPAQTLTASNTCGNINILYTEDRTDGDCPSRYSLLRTWTATNICGISISHTQTITVIDTTPPVLSLPANATAECSDDLSPIAFGTATATDNCDSNPIITFSDVRTDGMCSGTFRITRTWTATDACGNIATANQIISTSDTTAPTFDQVTLPQNITVECNNVPEVEMLTATDNCGNAIVTVNDVRKDGNCPANYEIERTYTATDDCGLTNTHIQIITVQDTTPPTFVETLPVNRLTVECDALPTAETLTATDTCGSATVTVNDVRTNGDCINNYFITRTWTATDQCNLTTTHTQIITVQDTTPPTFVETLPGDITVECDNIQVAETFTATDNCGNAIVTVNDVITNGDCPSNYTIARTWTATDECNLTTTHTQTITVQDTTAPVPTTTFDITLNASCTDIPETPNLEFTDNCSTNITVVFNETNSFNEDVLEDYEIVRTWTVTDECNNQEVYTQTVQVALDEVFTEIVAEDRCLDEGVLNLNNLLFDDIEGTWEILEGDLSATLSESLFDPSGITITRDFVLNGKDYKFRHTSLEGGCITTTEITMKVIYCVVLPCGQNDIVISKSITPNGDGFNETFDIEGIDLCGFTAEVKIFNRWGALVYESNNYTLGSLKTSGNLGDWDGSSKTSVGNAGKLPNGTYYYIINLRDSGLSPITGPVYLGTK
ncbi:hypothetical protein A8C32_02770 [Flavivirga aquatica]|uniref:HYR-like domain-containing protein n=2 Tax=Flavivirga aquatica TaxID=1849968 RepID=A0A1E5TAK1_9FLAO|nr:hypothetical protein A8C32_02770 [Flavivirga aquatica]